MPLRPSRDTASPSRDREVDAEQRLRAAVAGLQPRDTQHRVVAQIGGAHRRVGADGGGCAAGDDGAPHQHGHAVGQGEHRIHVVLHQQHGEPAAQALQQREQAGRLVMAYPGHRLVQQQQLRRAGQGDGQFEVPLSRRG